MGDAALGARARAVIARQTQHLSRLVEDLLDVSRVMAGKIAVRSEPVDVAAVAERVVTALAARHAARAGDLSLAAQPVRVLGDAVRLEQVINNLVENALRYTPAGGHVAVTVHEEHGVAVLAVDDDGVGIAPDVLPHFEATCAAGGSCWWRSPVMDGPKTASARWRPDTTSTS